MSLNGTAKKLIHLAGKILSVGLLAVAALASRRSASYFDPYGLLFIIVGGAAGALMTFSGGEIRTAFAHAGGTPGSGGELRVSALFWEATARNFWILGVMRSILSFVISLRDLTGGFPALTSGLANSLLAALYGMLLSVISYIPYWKLETSRTLLHVPDGTAPSYPARDIVRNPTFGHIVGYVLFAILLFLSFGRSPLAAVEVAAQSIAYWPGLLVVFGGTLALMLFLGDAAPKSAVSPAFAATGMIGSLLGFVHVLLGISGGSIEEVSSALTFILSACSAALLGMFLVGAPLEDRAAKGPRENARTTLGRAAWYVFPLLALVFLVAVFILIITPFERHQ
jgi:hypothetical protein